jgi:hypothetical protein
MFCSSTTVRRERIVAFSWQQRLHERATVLRHIRSDTNIATNPRSLKVLMSFPQRFDASVV